MVTEIGIVMNFFDNMKEAMSQLPKKRLSSFEPGRNENCLCGSKIKFKNCCSGKYSHDASDKAHESYNKGNYSEALIYARRHITWYVLCYKSHTVRLLEAGIPHGREILKVDINALAELLERLHHIYHRMNQSSNFPNVLVQFEDLIPDKRWFEKIIYLRALWHLLENDEEEALKTLSPINMDNCFDPEILTLYVQVDYQNLGFKRKIELVDRVISNSVQESYKLQYSTFKGVEYCLINQFQDGIETIKAGTDRYKELDEEKKTTYGDTIYAHSLGSMGEVTGDRNILEEAVRGYSKLIKEAIRDDYPGSYLSDQYHSIGGLLIRLGDYDSAIGAFEESQKLTPTEITKIFQMRAFIHKDEIEKARQVINSVDIDVLNDGEFFDFALSWTILAITTCIKQDLDTAINYLKLINNESPFFTQLRDEKIIELLETDPIKEGKKIRSFIKELNESVMLKPNIFGFGIDFNRIIEVLSQERDE